MPLETVLIQALVGLSSGMILFIVASGLSLIFGVLRVINFAHGSLYMLGAFLATSIGAWLANQSVGFFGALLIAPLVVAGVGALLEMGLFRRVYQREHLLQLLLTYGLTLIIADVVRMVWGGEILRLSLPEFLSGTVKILDRRFAVYNLLLLAIGPAIAIGLGCLLRFTRWGRLIRAAVDNAEVLGALGIDTRRIYTAVFALGCWLAGLGGVLIAGRASVSLQMDADIIVQCFAVVVIGGLGSFTGALIASVMIGVVVSLGTLFPTTAGFAQALPFVVMALILVVRPWGLMGKAER
jgi:branched-chain amino acid transport system permease protein